MILLLTDWLGQLDSGFGVLQYITLRSIMAALTALLISLMIGPRLIRFLSRESIGQQVREDGPSSHFDKRGTPTMGGALILVAMAVSVLLWADLGVHQVWIVLLTTLAFGVIGWVDDYRKIVKQNSAGLSAREKYGWQSLCAAVAAITLYLLATSSLETTLIVPFFKDVTVALGVLFIPFAYFVIVG
ncbi:MAG: phospho-N-acetylmuramoyl-pentapeptide-transferase, partial [Pseudomonadota bacterium]